MQTSLRRCGCVGMKCDGAPPMWAIDTDGMAEPRLPLAACGGRDRLDRQLVLFHPSRPEPEAERRPARRASQGEAWQVHGGGFYRIDEISGRAGADARRADMVQMGGLHDLAVRLRADGRGLLSRCRAVPGRQVDPRPHAVAGRRCSAFASLALAWLLYEAACRVGSCQARTALAIGGYPVPGRRSLTPSPMS